MRTTVLRFVKTSAAGIAALLIAAPELYADSVSCLANGDWSNASIWSNVTTATTPYTPQSTDDIVIYNKTVAFDLNNGTFNSIHVYGGSGVFYFKMTDGVNDIRELHITDELRSGNGGDYEYTRLYIGGSYGGGSIEAGDEFRLVFDSNGAQLVSTAQRSYFYIQGYSPANRNVKVYGAGSGVYGVINLSAGRDGHAAVSNMEGYNLSQVHFGHLGPLSASYFHDYAPTTAYAVNAVGSISDCVFDVVQSGIANVPGTCRNSSFIRASRGGRCFNVPEYPIDNGKIRNNTIARFNEGFYTSMRCQGTTFASNTWDDCNYGIYWGASHEDYADFDSIDDVFGGTTPNSTYDIRIVINRTPAHFNFDGTVLASDPNPLNELYYQFNNGGRNFIAWRDFDGKTGDYRVWSGDDGLLWSDMTFPPRATDTLTLESDQAYSANTPTTLTLVSDTQIGDIYIDSGCKLVLNGFTLRVNHVRHSLEGTVDDSAGGAIDWVEYGTVIWVR